MSGEAGSACFRGLASPAPVEGQEGHLLELLRQLPMMEPLPLSWERVFLVEPRAVCHVVTTRKVSTSRSF